MAHSGPSVQPFEVVADVSSKYTVGAPGALPSQFSSIALPQISGEGCTLCTHWSWPLTHVIVPAAQAPSRPVLHAAPPPGLPSSIAPSQSSSTWLQVSTEG